MNSNESESTEPADIQISLTSEYQQNLRMLAKRYRSIRSDPQTILDDLQVGNFVGDRIAGIGERYAVYKARVRNRDIQKGKSAGYRLIYLVESHTSVLLLTIYSKSDQSDISTDQIRYLLREFYD